MKISNFKFQISKNSRQRGSLLVYSVIIIFIFSLVMLGVLSYASIQLRVTRSAVNKELAFQIAEAGADYYKWHLAHFQTDYYDGNASTTPGPYVHNYVDTDTNQVVGQYSLTITPPSTGSTVTTIKSTGYSLVNSQETQSVTVRYGIPSLAQYAFLTNGDAWIGGTESVSGPFFSNGGLRFDGTGNAPIMSAKSTYACTPTFACSPTTTKAGIWGAAPTSTQAYWSYPQPNVDFTSMTSDLATMKSNAQSAGIYLAPSNAQGYSLVFKNDGTIDIYKVTVLNSDPTGWDVNGTAHNNDIDYSTRVLQSNQVIPANGIIYVEDNTWVEGVVKGRAIVAAAKLPYNAATAPNIIIQDSVTYFAKDGTNSLGLIAQQDFLVGYLSPNNLEIDGALIAQNGSAQRWYFPGDIKNLITIYGSTASFGTWTWSWLNGAGVTVSGYPNTSTVYDSSLLYAPPPSFPLSSSGYQQISWSSN